ncbi:50S ribosomal protein L9 [Paremcibacter congregatus]|uniref:Large ribosomal subunit protein bL9 n=1 Tax=Paremcibacter congregatus TaxID=2043170 RepID=A0A2G4YXC1_9PROT|nr:50S ribosomal protein L9 [Paremcibacter congregatus]PHZ86086.1 50S ribosomal protein L9 [Paremcibacter congregatus]QDE27052.1 50S ribosomal protein L9 [Paremcibacter congregatus]
MEIILLERVRKLGQIGDIVTVKDGFARNFLLPQKKALRSNKANRDLFEGQRAEIEARNLEAKSEAEAVAVKLEGASAVLIRQAGESGNLYGSVSARDISGVFAEQDLKIARTQVVMDHAIKYLGIYDIELKLHAEVSATVKVNVARSAEEAEMQEKGLDAKAAEEAEDISVEDYFEKEEDLEAVLTDDEAEEETVEETVAEEATEEEEKSA